MASLDIIPGVFSCKYGYGLEFTDVIFLNREGRVHISANYVCLWDDTWVVIELNHWDDYEDMGFVMTCVTTGLSYLIGEFKSSDFVALRKIIEDGRVR